MFLINKEKWKIHDLDYFISVYTLNKTPWRVCSRNKPTYKPTWFLLLFRGFLYFGVLKETWDPSWLFLRACHFLLWHFGWFCLGACGARRRARAPSRGGARALRRHARSRGGGRARAPGARRPGPRRLLRTANPRPLPHTVHPQLLFVTINIHSRRSTRVRAGERFHYRRYSSHVNVRMTLDVYSRLYNFFITLSSFFSHINFWSFAPEKHFSIGFSCRARRRRRRRVLIGLLVFVPEREGVRGVGVGVGDVGGGRGRAECGRRASPQR